VTALYKEKQKKNLLMKNAGEHAMKDHGYKQADIMTPEMKDKIRSHIRKS
jgi:predicted small metal-binding protein